MGPGPKYGREVAFYSAIKPCERPGLFGEGKYAPTSSRGASLLHSGPLA